MQWLLVIVSKTFIAFHPGLVDSLEWLITLIMWQGGRYFADELFKFNTCCDESSACKVFLNTFDDKLIMVHVMAWCCQATIHYLNQCWPRSMLPYDVTRPQWVNHNILIMTESCHKTRQLLTLLWQHCVDLNLAYYVWLKFEGMARLSFFEWNNLINVRIDRDVRISWQ